MKLTTKLRALKKCEKMYCFAWSREGPRNARLSAKLERSIIKDFERLGQYKFMYEGLML